MVINPPLILVSALFFLALSSVLYLASWLITTAGLRILRGRISHAATKRVLMTALTLPPVLAAVPTVGGATFKHSHAMGGMEHHSMLCQQMFTSVFQTTSVNGNTAVGFVVNGWAWIMALAGISLLVRLFTATISLERGLAPFLMAPTPKLSMALVLVAQRAPYLQATKFYECAIPASYSSVLGFFNARCVLSRQFVEEATDDELVAVIAHEAAHMRSRDVLATFAVGALNCLFFAFRPVRLLARRWREAAELACDDAAVAATRNPLAMASAILRASGAPVANRPIARALPATALAFADETACAPSKRVERLIAQAKNATLPQPTEPPMQALGAWAVTLLLAAIGVTVLVSAQAVCFAHCSLEAVAKLFP
ncbi:MAG: M56 family metallopeptidase [Capsulimonas sp.]|uniref:M56 family metallopeptidase n=1 Tax=Capsulimonas sp. TaxID=2494211 RepID=UPI0032655565